MIISIISAASENNVIGLNNKMPWHIPQDLIRFKKLTLGHTVIMGRKTYESLPFKPLPKRRNIVISTQKNMELKGAEIANSPEQALKMCTNENEVFIIGGGTIYKYFLPKAQKIYLTKVHKFFNGDTYFPKFDENLFIKSETEKYLPNGSNFTYSFINYIKK